MSITLPQIRIITGVKYILHYFCLTSGSGIITAFGLCLIMTSICLSSGNGIISAPDLRLIMTSMGEKLSEEQVEEMIQFADCEAQGEINYKGKAQRGI